jgi:acetylglutamate kinase
VVSATDRARPDATAPVVVKLGGRALESPGADAQLADELVALRGRAVLVHGGGAELSEWCLRLGLEPRFVDGLRATDEATLEVAVAVLAGLANKRLVARLRAGGVDAVGFSALDGGIAEAEPHPDAGQLGAVGRVRAVGADLIEESLARGRTPVLASIGACDGALLNLNADDLAAAVAGALRADALVLLSDVTGLVMDGALVEELNLDELDAVLAGPQVTGGMRPKLRAARAALLLGARRVHIAAWQGPGTLAAVLADAAAGTTISHAAPARSLHA